jgi:hypothetical protein
VFAADRREALQDGDAVRFSVSAHEPVYVAILGLDAKGQLSVYYPEGAQLAKVEAGHEQLLPMAIEWDEVPGREQLYGVFCPRPLPVAPVRAAIERSPQAPTLPPGCSFERRTLQGEAP